MCLRICCEAMNNTPALNSHRGSGRSGMRWVLPDAGRGRAGHTWRVSCATQKFLGGRLVGDLPLRSPRFRFFRSTSGLWYSLCRGFFRQGESENWCRRCHCLRVLPDDLHGPESSTLPTGRAQLVRQQAPAAGPFCTMAE